LIIGFGSGVENMEQVLFLIREDFTAFKRQIMILLAIIKSQYSDF